MNTTKTRILLLYYSNSGDTAKVTESLAESLRDPAVQCVLERLRPIVDYPSPWHSVARFFAVLPLCHFGPLPDLQRPGFDSTQKFDLVILLYQVWFLAPSLPIQSFMRSQAAGVLRNTKVITVSVSRNMWHCASQTMKTLLKTAGARHIDHVSVTHQGPAWATFVTAPRSLLFGKKEAFWGIFPPAGLSTADVAGLGRFGRAILIQRETLSGSSDAPLLTGLGAVQVHRRFVVPELIGWYWFRGWARVIQWLSRAGRPAQLAGVYAFVACLVLMIVIVLPVTLLIRLLLYPWMTRWTADYVKRLEEPSGS